MRRAPARAATDRVLRDFGRIIVSVRMLVGGAVDRLSNCLYVA